MGFSKKVRQTVYDKCHGHCAYCGCELTISDMQVDHVHSQYHAERHGEEVDNSIDNLMPACRQCNFYKKESDLEGFRRKLNETLRFTCCKDFNVRLAIKYGLINIGTWDGKFYFEKETDVNAV